MSRAFANPKLVFLMGIFIAILLRFLGFTTRYIWYDEAFSILLSEKGPASILAGTLAQGIGTAAAEEHPPLYYFLLNGWINIFGNSVPAVRVLSIIAGLGVVLLIYLIAHLLFGVYTANVALLLAAINPFQVYYSQEIRMYGFMAFWLMLAVYSFLHGRKSDDWKWWALFAVSCAFAQYTHNLSAFFLVALAAVPLHQGDWKTFRKVFLSGCLAIILYLPWLIHIPAQFAKIEHAYWIERPLPDRFFGLLLSFVSNPSQSFFWLAFGLFTALLIFALGLFQTVLTIRRNKEEAHAGVFLFYLSFMPPILLFIFSQWFPVYLERALLPSAGVFCLWLAWVFTRTQLPNPIRLFAFSLVFVSSMASFPQHLANTTDLYAPFDKIDASIGNRYQPGDVIIHSSKLSMLPAFYFDPILTQTFISDPPGGPTDTLSKATQNILGITSQPDLPIAANGAKRIWFVVFTRSIQEYISGGSATHPQLQYLKNNYQQDLHEIWGGVELFLFSRK